MAIDITKEPLLTLKDAAKLVPGRGGRATHEATLWRWCRYGRGGVKLEHLQRPSKQYLTTAGAVGRFLAGLTVSPAVSSVENDTAFQEADAKLEALGIGRRRKQPRPGSATAR